MGPSSSNALRGAGPVGRGGTVSTVAAQSRILNQINAKLVQLGLRRGSGQTDG